jgi:hypothetical protein
MFEVKHYFDDPHLKNAMKRFLCVHAAPADLRERVGKIVCPDYACMRGRAIALYITAGVVILASVATWVSSPTASAGQTVLPDTVAASLIRTHDRCCSAPDHHFLPGVARNDLGTAGAELAQRLQVPVIAAALSDWSFVGAGACPVWGHPSAHFLYRDGVRRLSVFTLPSSSFALGEAGNFSMTVDDHRVSGFLRSGALYCVVADSPDHSVTEKQADDLRDRLRDDFSPAVVMDDVPAPARAVVRFAAAPINFKYQIVPQQLSLFPTRLIAYHSMP